MANANLYNHSAQQYLYLQHPEYSAIPNLPSMYGSNEFLRVFQPHTTQTQQLILTQLQDTVPRPNPDAAQSTDNLEEGIKRRQ